MRLQIVINNTFEEEKALINIHTKEVLAHGDYYHNKIDEYIAGFLNGLSFANVQYELLDSVELTPDMELFNICSFENNNYDDCEDTENDTKDCITKCENIESIKEPKDEEIKQFNFVIYGDDTIRIYCNIIEALNKTRDKEADLYYEKENGKESIVYSCLGLEFEDNNDLLSKFGVIIDRESNKVKLLEL